MKKYIINDIQYLSITDLLFFLEQNFGIDYQNHTIKVTSILRSNNLFNFLSI